MQEDNGRGENQQEQCVELGLSGGPRITVRFSAMSEQVSHNLQELQPVGPDCPWWAVWEADSGPKSHANLYGFSDQEFELALCALKAVYDEDWLACLSPGHPILPSLAGAGGNSLPWRGLSALHLGSAIAQLGTDRVLSNSEVKVDLRGKDHFASRSFALEVLAWLKQGNPNLILEHELDLRKDQAKPDGLLRQHHYVEIKCLKESQREREFRSAFECWGRRLREVVGEGVWEATIDWGSPTTLAELQKAHQCAEAILARGVSPFEDREGDVRIRVSRAGASVPTPTLMVVNSVGPPPFELLELDRVFRYLLDRGNGIGRKVSALEQGSSLTLYVRAAVPILSPAAVTLDPRPAETLGRELFSLAIQSDPRIRAVDRICIEVWRAIVENDPTMRAQFKTRPFVFPTIDNPFFMPWQP